MEIRRRPRLVAQLQAPFPVGRSREATARPATLVSWISTTDHFECCYLDRKPPPRSIRRAIDKKGRCSERGAGVLCVARRCGRGHKWLNRQRIRTDHRYPLRVGGASSSEQRMHSTVWWRSRFRRFLVSPRGGVSTRVVSDGRARAASSIGGRTSCGQRRLRRRGFSFIL